MDKKDTIRKIDELFAYADKLAIELIESEARKILSKDTDLHEFVMAMGSCFFTAKENGRYDFNTYNDDDELDAYIEDGGILADSGLIIHDTDHFEPEFFEMVEDLNERFNSKGTPMRFTANSQIVSEWGDTRKNPVQYKER